MSTTDERSTGGRTDERRAERDAIAASDRPTDRRELLRLAAAGATVAALGLVGAPTVAAAVRPARGVGSLTSERAALPAVTPGVLDLYVNEGRVPMVDGTLVYMRGFGDRPTAADDPAPSLRLAPHVFLADGTLHASATYPLDAPAPPHGRPAAASGPDAQGLYEVRRAYWASYFPPRTIVAETGARLRLRVHNGLAGVHRLSVPGVLDTGDIAPGASAAVDVAAPAAGTYRTRTPATPRSSGCSACTACSSSSRPRSAGG
ncbi:hypothetical protein [Georgenia muralis]|uniref:hypothetical protein n=1 Tax=Georgenia muralis TaxID=154117 RepID=UPI001FE9A2E6|nr:hypothetical protein [Georgenia muralis]